MVGLIYLTHDYTIGLKKIHFWDIKISAVVKLNLLEPGWFSLIGVLRYNIFALSIPFGGINMRDEFDLLVSFNRLLRRWWLILVIAVVGGLIGLGVSVVMPPLYQAEAIFSASIDFTEINYENLVGEYGDPLVFTQYEEDLAMQVVQRVLVNTWDEAYEYALTLDPDLTTAAFKKNYQVQRYNALWYLWYRHEDPEIAQAVVNYWTEEALVRLAEAQESGTAESFVIIDFVSEAVLPQTPLYHNRNTLVLAGTLVGFFAGIILVDSSWRFARSKASEA